MILIADSGATKTDWRLLADDGSIQQAKTVGFNPYFITGDEIAATLRTSLLPDLPKLPREVFFYGAGCSTPDRAAVVVGALQAVFPHAEVQVMHDLLAAARALCGREAGVACILGTGSNSCLYDGRKITDQRPNLGFWLGDEGSGGHLGKLLLTDFMHGDLPAELAKKFERRYRTDRDQILAELYTQPAPNRHAASFAKFMFDHLRHPFVARRVYGAFASFLERYVEKYSEATAHPVHFTGSVAFYYSNLLRRVVQDRGLRLGRVLETPIAGLTLYHQEA
ncbi:MAG: N-acetylglucosamine kinase [Catalinimonas sp.]